MIKDKYKVYLCNGDEFYTLWCMYKDIVIAREWDEINACMLYPPIYLNNRIKRWIENKNRFKDKIDWLVDDEEYLYPTTSRSITAEVEQLRACIAAAYHDRHFSFIDCPKTPVAQWQSVLFIRA